MGASGEDDDEDPIRIGWDPVRGFVQHLEVSSFLPFSLSFSRGTNSSLFVQGLYPSIFLLFHSAEGSSTIGGIWNPSQLGPRQFKTGMGFPLEPVAGEGDSKAKVQLDRRAVLKEIERLGKGLVLKVELLQE